MGYHRAGFEVVGVDIAKQPRFPFEFHQADALTYLAEHWQEFDVIHASPPCQGYSVETPMAYRQNHPRTITKVRQALIVTGKPFVIENVPNAKSDMVNPVTLCGSMFGLRVWRHRCFEIVPELFFLLPPCDHSFVPVLVTGTTRRKGYPHGFSTQCYWRIDTGISLASWSASYQNWHKGMVTWRQQEK